MEREYIPPGTIGIISAVRVLAEHYHPERWQDIPHSEKAIWDDLPRLSTNVGPDQHIKIRINDDDRDPSWIERYADYIGAVRCMRDRLFSSQILASFLASSGEVKTVKPERWGWNDADYAIISGATIVPGEIYERYLFLPRAEFESVFGIMPRPSIAPSLTSRPAPSAESYRTGVAGRPTPAYLVLQHMATLDAVTESQAAFARSMCSWLQMEHPSAPRLTAKSLTNNPEFRTAFRELKNRSG